MRETAILEKRMADLCLMFCVPRIVRYPDGGVEYEYVWQSEDARLLFEYLKEQLIDHYVEMRKKQAEHGEGL